MDDPSWYKTLELFFATFIAAFVGVWAAYKIEREQRVKAESLDRLKDYCNVQMQLRLQHTLLKTIREYLQGYEQDHERFKKIAPSALPDNLSYLILDDVKFLLVKNNVLAYNIISTQQSISLGLSNYNKRNSVHSDWQSKPVKGRDSQEIAELKLCEKLLKEMTDINYSEIYRLCSQLEYFMDELSSFAKTEYKNIVDEDMYTEGFTTEIAKRNNN